MDTSLLIAFFGILLAAVMRTLLPYVHKVREALEKKETPLRWDTRYLWTCLSAFFTSFIIATLTLPNFPMPTNTTSQILTFIIAFGYGWGINDAYNKLLMDWH